MIPDNITKPGKNVPDCFGIAYSDLSEADCAECESNDGCRLSNNNKIGKTAFIICVNDSIRAAVIDDKEKAQSEMNQLKLKDFVTSSMSKEEYEDIMFWHLHEVKIL